MWDLKISPTIHICILFPLSDKNFVLLSCQLCVCTCECVHVHLFRCLHLCVCEYIYSEYIYTETTLNSAAPLYLQFFYSASLSQSSYRLIYFSIYLQSPDLQWELYKDKWIYSWGYKTTYHIAGNFKLLDGYMNVSRAFKSSQKSLHEVQGTAILWLSKSNFVYRLSQNVVMVGDLIIPLCVYTYCHQILLGLALSGQPFLSRICQTDKVDNRMALLSPAGKTVKGLNVCEDGSCETLGSSH